MRRATYAWTPDPTRASRSRPTRSSSSPPPASAGQTCGPTAASSRSNGPVADGTRIRRHRRRSRQRRHTLTPGQFVVGSFFASDNTCEICRAGYQSPACTRTRRRDRPRPSTLRIPLADGTLVATPEIPDARPTSQPARRVGRARHRLVRRRRRRGRPRQDRRGRRRRRRRPARGPRRQTARRRTHHRHEPPRDRQHLARDFGATDIVDRARRRRRRPHQGHDQRATAPTRHRGRRHPGVDDAGHRLHPPRRPRRLRRRLPRRHAARRANCSSPTSTCTADPPPCAGSCPTSSTAS